MNLLIIAIDLPKPGDDDGWQRAISAVRYKMKPESSKIWLARNVAVLDLDQRATIAPSLLADLRSHKLRYRLYGACDYPKELAEQIESYP